MKIFYLLGLGHLSLEIADVIKFQYSLGAGHELRNVIREGGGLNKCYGASAIGVRVARYPLFKNRIFFQENRSVKKCIIIQLP